MNENTNLEKTIICSTAILEITNKCYTNCKEYCYKGAIVGPKQPHISLDILKKRIDWIKKNTDAEEIYIIGGEPGLYPELKPLTEYIQEQDIRPGIITSGKFGSNVANRDYIIDLYSKGELEVELSYHPGKNELEYLSLHSYLKSEFNTRRKNIIAQIKQYTKKKNKINANRLNNMLDQLTYSTITISENNASINGITNIFDFLLEQCNNMDLKEQTFYYNNRYNVSLSEVVDAEVQDLSKHFISFEQSEQYNSGFSIREADYTHRVKIWGATLIKHDSSGITTYKTKGSENHNAICPGMKSSYSMLKRQVSLDSLLIRTDGEMTFSEPSCIASSPLLGNVDNLNQPKEIFSSIQTALDFYNKLIIETKSARAKTPKELCKQDSRFPEEFLDKSKYVCASCNFNIACNICNKTDKSLIQHPTQYIQNKIQERINIK